MLGSWLTQTPYFTCLSHFGNEMTINYSGTTELFQFQRLVKMQTKTGGLGAIFLIKYCVDFTESASIASFKTLFAKLVTVEEREYFVTSNKEFWMELTCASSKKKIQFLTCAFSIELTQKSEPNLLKADLIWTNCTVAKHISLEVPSAVRSIESNIWKDDFITAPNSSLLGQKGSMDMWLQSSKTNFILTYVFRDISIIHLVIISVAVDTSWKRLL